MEKLCMQCPRHCSVDRIKKLGFCGADNQCKIAKIMFHHWEEPTISGTENSKGSGAIFFSHCNLQCVYCQNYEISHQDVGQYYTVEQLAQVFKDLEQQGALNINLVTPTHYSKNILEALKIYKPKIPVVWNTSGYDDVEMLEQLRGYVDIFLTDFKYFDNQLASRYSACPNYFEVCTAGLKKMREICPKDVVKNGLMKAGIIVRHMVLPTHTEDSLKVLKWIADNMGTDTILSLMSQYTPHGRASEFPEIARKLKPLEYKRVYNYMLSLGFEDGFTQDMSSACGDFIPDFLEKKTSKIKLTPQG